MKYSMPNLVQFHEIFDHTKQTFFLKLLIWNNSKFPYEKLTFLLDKL